MPGGRLRREPVRGALGLALLAFAATASGQAGDPRTAMTRTVLDQLAAFRRDDWEAAYAHASSMIQAHFGLEAFRQMVMSGYAPIARSARAAVSNVEVVDAGHGFVEVRVEGVNGETVDALYELVDEQGSWRINGVLTRPASDPSTGLPAGSKRPTDAPGVT
jgi:hypothetical protein